MKKFFCILYLTSSFCFSQISDIEFELIKTYKQNLVEKDLNKTIQSLHNLIDFHKGETQYHISLGYIYQLQRNKRLAKNHLEKGKSFIIDQLITAKLSPKQTMDHVVALCFAGFDKECEEMFTFSEARFVADDYYSEYEFETVQKLAEKQREIMKTYFNK